MQSSMLRHITEDFGNGGTIDGDLTISGDLTVSGGGSISLDEIVEGTSVIDVDSTTALVVRKNGASGDVFIVDTDNGNVGIGGTPYSSYGSNFSALSLNGTKGGAIIYQDDGVAQWAIRTTDDNTLRFNYSSDLSSEAMRIDSSGNVGIGSSPNAKVDIRGDDLFIGNADTDASSRIFFNENSSSKTQGFSLLYAGSANPTLGGQAFTASANTFNIIRHNNDLAGATALSIDRTSGNATFAGDITSDGNLKLRSGSGRNIYFTEADGTVDEMSIGYDQANQRLRFRSNSHSADRMLITKTGNVVVGSTVTTGSDISLQIGDSGDTHLVLGEDVNNYARMTWDASENSLEFHLVDSSTSRSNVLVLDSTGNVGIGDSSPDSKLTISDATNDNLRIGTRGGNMNIHSVTDAGASSPLAFEGSEFQFITGNIGIGVSPSTILNIKSAQPVLKLEDTTAYNSSPRNRIEFRNIFNADTVQHPAGYIDLFSSNSTAGNYETHMAFTTRTASSGLVEAMRIDSSQNLSIGTSADTAKYLKFVRGGSGTGSVRGSIGTNNSKLTFIGGSGSSSHMTLDSSGQLGIGTTIPNSLLEVSGTSAIRSTYTGTSSAGVGGALQLVQDDGSAIESGHRIGYVVFGASEDSSNTIHYGGSINAFATETYSATGNGTKLTFDVTANGATSRSTALTLDQDKDATFAGDVTIGSGGTTPDLIFSEGDSSIKGPLNANFLIISRGNDTDEGVSIQGADGAGLHVNKAGNVVIGQTTAQQKFEVHGGGIRIAGNIATPSSGVTGALIDYFGSDTRFWSRGADASTVGSFKFIGLENDGGNQSTFFILDSNSRISLSNNDSGISNTIFGKNAGQNLDAGSDYNVFIGQNVSDASMADATFNVAMGYEALSELTSGDSNVSIGAYASQSNTTARYNSVLGTSALQKNGDGEHNVAIGYSAGRNDSVGNNVTSPDQCIAIGSGSGFSTATPGNQIAIGYNVKGLADNSVTLGNASVTNVYLSTDRDARLHCGGVDLGEAVDSSDAEVLDDYEEGEHTATVTCGTSGTITVGSTYQTLSYVKIGSMVTVNGSFSIDSVSSPDGYFTISLPFTIGDGTGLAKRCSGSVTAYGVSGLDINKFVVLGIEQEARIRVYAGDATTLVSDSANSVISGTNIVVNVTYFV